VQNDAYIRKLQYRSSHRGTREADAVLGGFFEKYHRQWTTQEYVWFELLLEEQDVDIVAWVSGRDNPPEHLQCETMDALMCLDFIDVQKAY
jgi:antitoxin CptB